MVDGGPALPVLPQTGRPRRRSEREMWQAHSKPQPGHHPRRRSSAEKPVPPAASAETGGGVEVETDAVVSLVVPSTHTARRNSRRRSCRRTLSSLDLPPLSRARRASSDAASAGRLLTPGGSDEPSWLRHGSRGSSDGSPDVHTPTPPRPLKVRERLVSCDCLVGVCLCGTPATDVMSGESPICPSSPFQRPSGSPDGSAFPSVARSGRSSAVFPPAPPAAPRRASDTNIPHHRLPRARFGRRSERVETMPRTVAASIDRYLGIHRRSSSLASSGAPTPTPVQQP